MEPTPTPKHLIVRGKSASDMYKEIHDVDRPRHLSKEDLEKKRGKFKQRIDRRKSTQ